ncbi:hypothetical protein [Solibacillus sp. FSL K6-1523]|uniref:hypothetical protein n=1 Tax=Solibacillus sp. FSL K6-1523 TaxID=2921471 RepID=UPI0030F791E0
MLKNRYISIVFVILIASAVFLLYTLKIGQSGGSIHKPVEQATSISKEQTGEKKTLSMMEAVLLGYEEAKKYTEEEPLLIHLTSTDDTTSSQGKNEGADGKRIAWNVLFGSKKGNIHINLYINDGKVDAWMSEDDNNLLQKGQYAVSDIKIDSPEAIKKAIEVLDIQPEDPKVEDDWIKGYHFSISGFLTDPNSSERRYLLRIMGISPNSPNSENDSLRMTVFFDVKTGEMVNASEMTGYDKDDRTDWKEVELEKMPSNK